MTKQFTIIFLLIAIVTNDFGWTSASNGLPLSADQWYELFGYHKSPHSRETLEKILRAQHADQANFDPREISIEKTSGNNQSLEQKEIDATIRLRKALYSSDPDTMKHVFERYVPDLPFSKLLHTSRTKTKPSFLERCIKRRRNYSSTTAVLVRKIKQSGPENTKTALHIVKAITSKTNTQLQQLQEKEMKSYANLQNRLRYARKAIRDLNQISYPDTNPSSKNNPLNHDLSLGLETTAGDIDFFGDDSEPQLQQEKR
jgi:hypothetical protein